MPVGLICGNAFASIILAGEAISMTLKQAGRFKVIALSGARVI